eukprot:c19262_g1_i1.p1 GENE.c19262_g1_i1~~c19262_g1_i1.p1  ORF type:complete len:230 (+),score=35.80 c19262_g1_i1:47-691(+)
MWERWRFFLFLCLQTRIWVIFWASCFSLWLGVNRATGGVNVRQKQSQLALIMLFLAMAANFAVVAYLSIKHLKSYRHCFYKYYLVTTDRLYILHIQAIFALLVIATVMAGFASMKIPDKLDVVQLWISIATCFQFLSSQYTKRTPAEAFRRCHPNDIGNNILLNYAKDHCNSILTIKPALDESNPVLSSDSTPKSDRFFSSARVVQPVVISPPA